MGLEEIVCEGNEYHTTIDLVNVNNNNKVFTASPAGEGLPDTPLHRLQPSSEQQLGEPPCCDGNVNESAGGQQGAVLQPPPPAYDYQGQYQGYPPAQGYPPPQQGYPPPHQGYPPPQQGYPPPQQGYYPPPPQGYPPPQQGYPPPQQVYYAPANTQQGRPQQVTVVYTVPAQQGYQNQVAESVTTSSSSNSTFPNNVVIIKELFEDPRERNAFIRKVYCVLLVQLLVATTCIGLCVFVDSVNKWVTVHFYLLYLFLFFYLACAIVMCCCMHQLCSTNPVSIGVLIVLTVSMSLMAGFISSKHGKESVFLAIVVTAGIVFLLTILAFQTSYDFTSWMGAMFVILLIFMLFGFFSVILSPYIPMIRLIYACFGALIMSVYIVIDTQTLMSGKRYSLTTDMYIFGAISLFVDIVLLFLYILQIVDNK